MLAGMDSILFRARVLIYGTVSQALIYGTVSQALITTKLKDSPFTKVLVEGRIFFTELLIGDKKVFHDIFINFVEILERGVPIFGQSLKKFQNTDWPCEKA